jgi:hypothetical protein
VEKGGRRASNKNVDEVKKVMLRAGNTKRRKYHGTVDLLFDWYGIVRGILKEEVSLYH